MLTLPGDISILGDEPPVEEGDADAAEPEPVLEAAVEPEPEVKEDGESKPDKAAERKSLATIC